MKTKSKSQRPLSFEQLETRALLAGNVVAALDGFGNLSLTGDSRDNVVTVAQASNGKWVVRGLLGTTINGKSLQTYYADSIKANLGNGNDAIAVLKGELLGELCIATGNGSDAVALVRLEVGGLRLNTGSGNDVVFVNSVDVQLPLPTFASTTSGGSYGKAYINTGAGMDMTLLSNLKAYNICVDTGAGIDFTGLVNVCSTNLLSVKTGTEYDALGVVKSKARTAQFDGGDRSANLFAGAKNSFGSESNNFSAKLKLDAIANQVETLISTAKTYLKSIPGIGNLPNLR